MLRVDAALTGTDRDPCTALGQTPKSQRASVLGHTYRNRNLSGEMFSSLLEAVGCSNVCQL